MTTTGSPAGGEHELAVRAVGACEARRLTVGTAESVTAGLVAGSLASVPGSSRVLRGGVVAYATEVKATVLGVPEELLAHVVSERVAVAMAAAATRLLGADLGIATTGVAGPEWLDGQPPGTVWIAVHEAGSRRSASRQLSVAGDRARVRRAAVEGALRLLIETVSPGQAGLIDRPREE